VADGTITVSYRLWSRPKVNAGGTYRSGFVMIEVDEIELLPYSSITLDDLALTGERDFEALRERAAHAGPIHDDTSSTARSSTSWDKRPTRAADPIAGSGHCPARGRRGPRQGADETTTTSLSGPRV
jgi:hypothetical protein